MVRLLVLAYVCICAISIQAMEPGSVMLYDDIQKRIDLLFNHEQNPDHLEAQEQFEFYKEGFELLGILQNEYGADELLFARQMCAFRVATLARENNKVDRSINFYAYVVHNGVTSNLQKAAAVFLSEVYIKKNKLIAASFYCDLAEQNKEASDCDQYLYFHKAFLLSRQGDVKKAVHYLKRCIHVCDDNLLGEKARQALDQIDQKRARCVVL